MSATSRVEVTCGPGVHDGQMAATVESTAYFTVCEALANALKHDHQQGHDLRLGLTVQRAGVLTCRRLPDPSLHHHGRLG